MYLQSNIKDFEELSIPNLALLCHEDSFEKDTIPLSNNHRQVIKPQHHQAFFIYYYLYIRTCILSPPPSP